MQTTKSVTLRFHSFTLENIEAVIRKQMPDVIKKQTIAIFGGTVSPKSRINKTLLKALCTNIGTKLGKKKFNIITMASPEIPMWIAKAASKAGASVWTISDASSSHSDNDYANVSLKTLLDHEFVNYLVSDIADIGIMIDGGIGSLIKGAIMVDYEKPLICMKNTGGSASMLPEILRESVHNFQDLNLYEAETVNELMRVLSRLTDGRILLQSKLQRIYNQVR